MSFPSPKAWQRLAREIEILDDARVSLGTVRGVLRGLTERDLEGGAASYDALLIVPKTQFTAAGIPDLRRYMHVNDPLTDSMFSVMGTRFAVWMQGAVIIKAELEGMQ